jgi:DDE superfamily endonuclease
VSGKRKQNTIKTATVSDGRGRTLWAGAVRPGRMHDQTAVKTDGIWDLFQQYPTVTARVDTGYRGLAKAFADRVCAPPLPPAKDAPAEQVVAYPQAGKHQSSRRICVGHAIAEHKQRRPLQRYLGRREAYAEAYLAIAGLVSDRAARRRWATTSRTDQAGAPRRLSRTKSLRDFTHQGRDHRRAARIDRIPRSVRFKAREVEKAYAHLENRLTAPPPTPRSPSSSASPPTTSCTTSSTRSRSSRWSPSTSC